MPTKGTFSLIVGGKTVQDLPFAEEDIRRVQRIGLIGGMGRGDAVQSWIRGTGLCT